MSLFNLRYSHAFFTQNRSEKFNPLSAKSSNKTFIGFFGDYLFRKVQGLFQDIKVGVINKSELYECHPSENY